MKLHHLVKSSGAELLFDGKRVAGKKGGRVVVWTLVETLPAPPDASSRSSVVGEDSTLTASWLINITRGTWLAPETRNVLIQGNAAPCVPAQLFVPLMTRWMLVFEAPESETLWLGKVIPRESLADGKRISVSSAPTRWGLVSFSIASRVDAGKVVVDLDMPSGAPGQVRLRAPGGATIQNVQANGKARIEFDAAEETVTMPQGSGQHVRLEIYYR